MIDVGAEITVITTNGSTVRAKVSILFANPSPRPGFRWHTAWDYSEISFLDEEHTRWIRGYHDEGSDEINALKAAAAMTARPKPVRASELPRGSSYHTTYGGGGD